ncbi:hypothetical protein K458DRAFT_29968 [Lentithecium fluviatile CBS 122367]|uniref:Uncharacterized protein n=1 Tax=Lentithecium fluviatile CBS 122367 TaxID=1168545 RepID=A0A6G1J237_9PLEO|nr:hypothetical protein K458DRAFT_29968 [Lentithecium fluviatile CBS 122367]
MQSICERWPLLLPAVRSLAPAAVGPARANGGEQPSSLLHQPSASTKAICDTRSGVWALLENIPSRPRLGGHLWLRIGGQHSLCRAAPFSCQQRAGATFDLHPLPSVPRALRVGRPWVCFAFAQCRCRRNALSRRQVGHHRQRMRRDGCPSLRQCPSGRE